MILEIQLTKERNLFGWNFPTAPPLNRLVSIVVSACSKPQVGAVDAKAIIASGAVVQNAKAIWDGTDSENPRKNVSINPAVSLSKAKAFREPSVSVPDNSASPKPASVSLLNLAPKSLNDGGSQSLTGEVLRRYRDHAISGFARYALQGLASIFFVATRNANLNVFPSSRSLAFGGYWQAPRLLVATGELV